MPNPKRYQAIVLGSKGCDINFQCANETITTSNEINLLGAMLDSKLKFDAHVASVCRKVGGQVNVLNRLQNNLPCKVKQLLYRTSAYHELLQRIGLGTTLENRRVQDMLTTINACFQGTAPTCIKELVKMRKTSTI